MLILLDIDGVMLPANAWKKPEFLEDGFVKFSNAATKGLNKILSATQADIVLTSSHKHKYNIDKWKDIFKNRDIVINNLFKLPDNIAHLSRKDEILNWLNTHNICGNFIIIDDDKSLNELPFFIKNKLIQTSSTIGLTENIADIILKLLKENEFIFS